MIDGKDKFDIQDLREELEAIWGEMPYSISSSTPSDLKKTTLVEAKCRACQESKKLQISSLLRMKDEHGCFCTSCRSVKVSNGEEEVVEEEADETPAVQTIAEVDGKESPINHVANWREALDEKVLALADELKYIPFDDVELIDGGPNSATLKYTCANCGNEHRIQIKSVDELKIKELKGQKYFACITCGEEIKKNRELNSLKKRVVTRAQMYGFESVAFSGPLIERTTQVKVGIGEHTWTFQAQDIMEPHEDALHLDEHGKFIAGESEPEAESFRVEPETTAANAVEAQDDAADDEIVAVTDDLAAQNIEVAPTIVIDDEDGPPELGGVPLTETITIDEEYEDEISSAQSASEMTQQAFEEEIVGDVGGIPVARGIEITEDEWEEEIVQLNDGPVKHAGQETIRSSSETFDQYHQEFQANRVFRDDVDVLASHRYSDRLEQNDIFIKFLDRIRDFTGVGYERKHHTNFMDVPVALIKVPGSPFSIIYINNKDRSYQSYVVDHNAINQVFQPILKTPVFIVYSDQIEHKPGQLAANVAKMIDRIRKDSRALPDHEKIHMMEINRYYLAFLEDRSVCNEFADRYSPFPTHNSANKTLAVVGIDRKKNDPRKIQENMLRIQRALLSGRNIDTGAFNWRIPCAIRYIEGVEKGVTHYTITQYIENFDLFLEDGLETAVGMLIWRHFTTKGGTPFDIKFEYRPYEYNPPSVNKLMADKKRGFAIGAQPMRAAYYVNTNAGYVRTEQRYFNPRSLVTMFGNKLDRVNLGDPNRINEFMKSEGYLLYQAPMTAIVTIDVRPYLASMYGMASKDPRASLLSRIVGHVEQPTVHGSSLDFDKDTQKTMQFIAGREYMQAAQEYANRMKEQAAYKAATEGEGVEAPQAEKPKAPQLTPQQLWQQQMLQQQQFAYQQMMWQQQMGQRR